MLKWYFGMSEEEFEKVERAIAIGAVVLLIVESIAAWVVTRGL